MRYSRMLEESSFANKKADYFWLLLLSSVMLLVRRPSVVGAAIYRHFLGSFAPCKPSLPFLLPSLRANLPVVKTASVNANFSVWHVHNYRTLPPSCVGRVLLGAKWNLESCYCRSSWLCCGSCRLVLEGRMDEGDGWRLNYIQ